MLCWIAFIVVDNQYHQILNCYSKREYFVLVICIYAFPFKCNIFIKFNWSIMVDCRLLSPCIYAPIQFHAKLMCVNQFISLWLNSLGVTVSIYYIFLILLFLFFICSFFCGVDVKIDRECRFSIVSGKLFFHCHS